MLPNAKHQMFFTYTIDLIMKNWEHEVMTVVLYQ